MRHATLAEDAPDLAVVLFNLGTSSLALGRPGDSLEYLAQALEVQEHALGPDHDQVALTLTRLLSKGWAMTLLIMWLVRGVGVEAAESPVSMR